MEAHLGARCARFCTVSSTMNIDGINSGPKNSWKSDPATTSAADATGMVCRISHGAMCNTMMVTMMRCCDQVGQRYQRIGKEAESIDVDELSRSRSSDVRM